MPCNSDYLKPTRRERELQRAAGLLVFVRKATGAAPEAWAEAEAENIYAHDERSVTELCAALKALSEDDLSRIVYNARDKTSRDLADWWEAHQAADREREARERAESARAEAVMLALAKLHRIKDDE